MKQKHLRATAGIPRIYPGEDVKSAGSHIELAMANLRRVSARAAEIETGNKQKTVEQQFHEEG